MCPKLGLFSRFNTQTGMALIAVIFIMIVMSGAVLMMSRLADMQAAERTMDINGARAQSAAQAGLSWTLYQIKAAGAVCPASPTTFALHSETDLAGFSVTITCTAKTYSEGVKDVTIYNVESSAQTASFETTGEHVFRKVSAVIELET